MNKWSIQPEQWQSLPRRQKRGVLKTGIGLAGRSILALTLFSLLVEAVLGL